MKIDPDKQFGTRICPGCNTPCRLNENRCPICNYDFPQAPRTKAMFKIGIGVVMMILFLLLMLRIS